ncbi:hypothetical protein ABW20_dc0110369 [Dactylellina cionopaga]|nr:hypothetical protein ABW20_dc0110369 [Dactylellina cionopaga]
MEAFTDSWSERHLAGVVLAGSVLSIVGSLYMIFGFIILRELRTFRHKLILGLAISDLLLALNFFIPSLSMMVNQSGSSPSNSIFCSANGFLTQFFFAQIDIWQLTIAIVTWFMLSGPTSAKMLKWAREHVYALFLFPWIISLIAAFFGFGIWDYADVGAYCWLGSTHVRLYFNYLPRWVIIFACLAIYVHIFRIIRRSRRMAKFQKKYRATNAEKRSAAAANNGDSEKMNMSVNVCHHCGHHDEGGHGAESSSSLDSSRAASSAGMNSMTISAEHDPAVAGQIQTAAERAQEEEEQQKQIRKIAIQLISYPLAYAVLWSIPTIIMIIQVVKGRGGVSIHVEGLAKMMLVFNGFVDAHVYGFNERTAMGWRQKMRSASREDDEEAGEIDVESVAPAAGVHEAVSEPAPTFKTPNW